MASSLEDLLVKDGFRGRRSSGMRSRASFKAETLLREPLSPFKNKQKTYSPGGTSSHGSMNQRTRSDLSRLNNRGEITSSDSSSTSSRRSKLDRSKTKNWEMERRIGSSNDANVGTSHYLDTMGTGEIVEVGEDEQVEKVKYAYNTETTQISSIVSEDARNQERKEKVTKSSTRQYSIKSSGSSKNIKSSEDDTKTKQEKTAQEVPVVALDEVAIQAMVSILSHYIKRFLKDEECRTTLHYNCFSSLNATEAEQHRQENKVILNLEQAIQTVEKAAQYSATAKDLKKASLQLGVITGLNSNGLEDGSTAGIMNSTLSACAHIYLSVIFKLQKKDKASAKQLLQVFCDSPFLARTLWLPELWDYLFSAHLSDLELWYKQESDSLGNSPQKTRKQNILGKVYNEILDSGTNQLAIYYKDWLTEGVEAPSLPSIKIPSLPFQGRHLENSANCIQGRDGPSGPFSPQPMVSKKLYESYFGRLNKPGVSSSAEYDHGFAGSSTEAKQTLTNSSEMVKYVDQDVDTNLIKSSQYKLYFSENWSPPEEPETDVNDQARDKDTRQKHVEGDTDTFHSYSKTVVNELAIMTLAKSVFDQENEVHQAKVSNPFEELRGSYGCVDEGSFFETIPKEFICPLTKKLLEDPVTLETGQTFEREAITEWLEQGNQTCPVTGKALTCLTLPVMNFVLKRVVERWKIEHCAYLLAYAAKIVTSPDDYDSISVEDRNIFVLENLLLSFGKEDRLTNAKHLIAFGGLRFLIRKFRVGDLERKSRVAALLLCCIEADASCRSHVTAEIDRKGLFELLHCAVDDYERNAALLLTELVCMSRRRNVAALFSGLKTEKITSIMQLLLMHLRTSPIGERPSVAVLLLHLDLLVTESPKYSVYREEAVDAIAMALESSIYDGKILRMSRRALLMLGGCVSSSGELLIESWILKKAGFNNDYYNGEDKFLPDVSFSSEEEEEAVLHWLRQVSTSLIDEGKGSFLKIISKCLCSSNSDLVRSCLITIGWIAYTIPSGFNTQLQPSTLSTVVTGLKINLEDSDQIEHKVLASFALLYLSKIPDCSAMLTSAREILVALRDLAEVTWTAKLLYAVVAGEDF